MKPVSRRLFASALAVLLVTVSTVRAQVMDQVPSDALVVLKFKSIGATSAKLGKFMQDLGVASMKPGLEDPLGYLQTQGNIKEGLNKDGDLAVIYRDPSVSGAAEDKSMLILIPVTNYNAFIANFAGAKNDGDVTEVTLPKSNEPSFMAKWGDFAALAPGKEALTKPASMMKVTAAVTNKELSSKDVVLLANVPAMKTKFLPKLKENREKIMTEAEQNITAKAETAKFAPVLKAVIGKSLDMAESFLNDTSAVCYSWNFGTEGINISLLSEFMPDTYMAKLAGDTKSTGDTLLKGLPTEKYLFFGGTSADPKVTTKVFDDLTGSVVKEVAAMGPDYKPVLDYIDSFKAFAAANSGQNVGMIAPSGAIGQDAVIQFISLVKGDAKALRDAQAKMMKSQEESMKALGLPGDAMKTTLTPAAKTVEGVSFDSVTMVVNPDANSPAAQQQAQMMQMLYGAGGMNTLVGDSGTGLLVASGVSDTVLSATVVAAKSGAAPLADIAGVKSVAANLPKSRIAEFYVPVDQIVTTGLGYAKQFGAPVNMQLPPDLPPIGFAVSTEATTFRMDTYVPSSLVQSLVAATMQVMMQMQGGGGGL